MKDFLEGRKNKTAYTVFFERFVPCSTKKTNWDRRVTKASTTVGNGGNNKGKSLCTISDEAFALLLLENSFDRWFDLFSNRKGTVAVVQRRGVKERGFQSDVAPLYTRGGIKYNRTEVKQAVKGWSDEGMDRFNELFDHVKQDRIDNSTFEIEWLQARLGADGEGAGASNRKKHKRNPVVTRSELFPSDDEEESSQITGSEEVTGGSDAPIEEDEESGSAGSETDGDE